MVCASTAPVDHEGTSRSGRNQRSRGLAGLPAPTMSNTHAGYEEGRMPGQAIIVVGASAGGVEALLTLASVLPPDLPAAVLVVLHTSAHPSALPRLLSRRGPLPAHQATDGAPLQPGRIYMAPADHHLLVARGQMHVVQGPQEHGLCPAVDPLFRSAAEAYGPHVIGVILSGHLDDGTAGLLAVKRHGGVAVVQDPDEAVAPGMPRSALAYVAVDYTLPLAAMGPLLGRLAAAVAAGAEHRPDATPETAAAFLQAGCAALGVGSSLVSKEILQKKDWAELKKRAAAFVQAVRAARSEAVSVGP